MLRTNSSRLIMVLVAVLVCAGIATYWTARTHQDDSPETMVTILLPEAADLEQSIMGYYLKEAKEWVEEYRNTRDARVLIVSAPYHREGVWYDQKLLAMMVGRSEPDILFMRNDRLLELDKIEKLIDLASFGFECSPGIPASGGLSPAHRCIGVSHHALPDYSYAILNNTSHPKLASELLAFLYEKGTGKAP